MFVFVHSCSVGSTALPQSEDMPQTLIRETAIVRIWVWIIHTLARKYLLHA